MIPQGFAAPNAALNSSINRATALTGKLAKLGIVVTGLYVNPVGAAAAAVPLAGIPIAQVEAAGVGPDDLVHLVFQIVGGQGNEFEVAAVEGILAPATVSAVINLFGGLFPGEAAVQVEARALTALANLPAIATALKGVLA